MPVSIVDVDTFTDPVTAPAGADAADAASVVSPVQKLANRTRYLLASMFGAGARGTSRTLHIGPRDGDGEAGWAGATLALNHKTCNADTAGMYIDLSDHLPSGAVITEVHLMVKPGAARAVAGNRMKFELSRVAISTFPGSDPAGTSVATDVDDGTANRQLLSMTGLSETVDRSTTNLMVGVTSGNTCAANNDFYYGIRVVFQDPGGRSF